MADTSNPDKDESTTSKLDTQQAPNLDIADLMVDKEEDVHTSKIRRHNREQMVIEGNIKVVNQIDTPKDPLSVKYSEEFEFIAAGFADGLIRVYKTLSGEHVFTMGDAEVHNVRAPCTCVKHRPISKHYPITNCFTGTYANGCVKCWSYRFNQCVYTIREKRQTFGITYHPRFPKFVTYGDDRKVHFYDEESRTQERILLPSEFGNKHDGHMSRVFAACFHPKNNYELLTGGWDNVIHFWDLRLPNASRHISGVHMCGEGIDINYKGTEILACSFQNTETLQLFDYGSGKRIASLEPDIYPSKLYCGNYFYKDFIINGGADPHLFRLVDLTTTGDAACITSLPGGVYSMDVGPTRKARTERENRGSEEAHVRMKSDLSVLPRVAFVSGRKIIQIEFY